MKHNLDDTSQNKSIIHIFYSNNIGLNDALQSEITVHLINDTHLPMWRILIINSMCL